MKKLGLKILLFSMPLFIVFGFIEYKLYHIPNSFSYTRDQLESKLPNLETLFLGSSHIHFGINPEYLNHPAFNLAYTGQDFIIDTQLVYKYLDQMPKLKNVVIGLDIISFDYRLHESVESWRNAAYRRFFGIRGSDPISQLLTAKTFSMFFLLGRSNSLTAIKNGFDFSILEEISPYGYQVRKNQKDPITEEYGFKDFKVHLQITNPKHRNETLYEIKKLSSILANRNIKLTLLVTPVHQFYSNKINKTYKEFFKGTLLAIDSSDPNIKVINLLEDPSFVDEDFADSHHLNQQGSKKLTLKINEFL